MFKKFILIAGLSLSVFLIAHAQNQNLPSISQNEKFDIESTMNILKDIENNHINKDSINEFLNKYDISNSVKKLILSYNEQGLSYSDFLKLDYGIYKIVKTKNSFTSSNLDDIYNAKCENLGFPVCVGYPGYTCYGSNGSCH